MGAWKEPLKLAKMRHEPDRLLSSRSDEAKNGPEDAPTSARERNEEGEKRGEDREEKSGKRGVKKEEKKEKRIKLEEKKEKRKRTKKSNISFLYRS